MLPRVLDVPGLELLTRPAAGRRTGAAVVDAPTRRRCAAPRPYLPGESCAPSTGAPRRAPATLHTNEFDPTTLSAVRLLLDVRVFEHAWLGVDPARMELLCVVAASLAAAFAGRGFGVGLASNARLTGDWRAVDIEPREGALDDVLETLGRVLVFPPDDFGRVLSAELADDAAEADCVLVAAALRAPVRELLVRLRAERRVTVVYVGSPGVEERPFVDATVSGDFDWRMGDALPLVV